MTSETLVSQTQDVCGRFQRENWTEYVSKGPSQAVKHRKIHRKVQNVAKITPLQNDHTLLTLLFNLSKCILW